MTMWESYLKYIATYFAAAILYNAASLKCKKRTGQQFTANEPAGANKMMILFFISELICVSVGGKLIFQFVFGVGLASIIFALDYC